MGVQAKLEGPRSKSHRHPTPRQLFLQHKEQSGRHHPKARMDYTSKSNDPCLNRNCQRQHIAQAEDEGPDIAIDGVGLPVLDQAVATVGVL